MHSVMVQGVPSVTVQPPAPPSRANEAANEWLNIAIGSGDWLTATLPVPSSVVPVSTAESMGGASGGPESLGTLVSIEASTLPMGTHCSAMHRLKRGQSVSMTHWASDPPHARVGRARSRTSQLRVDWRRPLAFSAMTTCERMVSAYSSSTP